MKIWVGPVGSISRGHVLDCARVPLERALRDYDSQLYVAWNPRKLKGHGCWELRRRPEFKRIKPEDVTVFKGNTFVFPKYHENAFENHVLDIAFLNYSVLDKIKKMDVWANDRFGHKGQNFAKEIEYIEAKYDEHVEKKADEDLQYGIKQIKHQMQDFKEYLRSGGDPTRIAEVWGKTK